MNELYPRKRIRKDFFKNSTLDKQNTKFFTNLTSLVSFGNYPITVLLTATVKATQLLSLHGLVGEQDKDVGRLIPLYYYTPVFMPKVPTICDLSNLQQDSFGLGSFFTTANKIMKKKKNFYIDPLLSSTSKNSMVK